MHIKDVLAVTAIRIPLQQVTKAAIIEELIGLLPPDGQVTSRARLTAAIWERERLMSTGIGDGVAIPHARIEGIEKVIAAFGISHVDVDFEALDQQPTRLFFMVIGPQDQPRLHLDVLSRISRLFHVPDFRERLLQAQGAEVAWDIIVSEEKKYYEL
ncbi:PTS sugar transporter subunit IIA [candidate division KSB1 bacterium]|nr:PTS sugar transporter subunit IIA [candidate division KSB1 bacterium]